MFFDNSLLLSNAQAITSTAASTNIYDVTGAGSGNAPSMVFGTATIFGEDIGAGEGLARPVAFFAVTTTFTAGGSATMVCGIQGAIDNGSNAPSTYTTIAETQAIPVATLTSGSFWNIPIPPITIGEALPRFYRFYYTVATGPMTAGNLTAGIVLAPTSTLTSRLYPSNFTVI